MKFNWDWLVKCSFLTNQTELNESVPVKVFGTATGPNEQRSAITITGNVTKYLNTVRSVEHCYSAAGKMNTRKLRKHELPTFYLSPKSSKSCMCLHLVTS